MPLPALYRMVDQMQLSLDLGEDRSQVSHTYYMRLMVYSFKLTIVYNINLGSSHSIQCQTEELSVFSNCILQYGDVYAHYGPWHTPGWECEHH